MSDELSVSLVSAIIVVVVALIIRFISKDDREPLKLDMLDFTRELFAAAGAVFPTTLLIQPSDSGPIEFSSLQVGAAIGLVAVIAIWARFETRYFRYWREGERRTKTPGGELGDATPVRPARSWRVAAFLIGNALGVAVLFFAAAISHQVAS